MSQILSNEASTQLVNGILELAENIAQEKMERSKKRWLTQKEVKEEYRCGYKELARWESLGLTKREQGPRFFYDRKDIEAVLETLKQ